MATLLPSFSLSRPASHRRRSPNFMVQQVMMGSLVAGLAIAISSLNSAEALTSSVSSRTEAQIGSRTSFLISQLPEPVTLKLDDSGDAVSALQRRLTDLGFYSGPISGYFGEMTEAAVIEFQESNGLTADGVVGSSTTTALRNASSNGGDSTASSAGGLTIGSTGESVTMVQNRLTALGFYSGPISGYFGEMTEAAVIEFQESNGLTADGVVGPSTTAALRSAPSSNGGDSTASSAGGLTIGSTGESVTMVQNRLTALGFYDGPITGYYGELTEAAVIEFQKSNGLTADGVAGPATLAALQDGQNSTSNSTASAPDPNDGLLEQGETGPEVAQLQQRLRDLNYYNGPIDGDFGSLTADAVLRFQRAQGLTPDGVVGPSTLTAMNRVESGVGTASNNTNNSTNTNTVVVPPSDPVQGTVVPQNSATTQPPEVIVFPQTTSNPFPSTGGSSFSASSVPPTASQDAILELQRDLQDKGFYNGPIDGVMNFETQRALEAARNAYGINSSDLSGGSSF